jgi:hypothetical protein
MGSLTHVWESYERNGDSVCAFKSKELAENHELFEIGSVVECEVWLCDAGVAELQSGKAVW